MTDERVKVAINALKAAPVCVTQMTGDGRGYEVCRWVDGVLVVVATAPAAEGADVLKDEIDRRAKAEAVIAALDAHDGAPIGWRPIDTAVCDDRLALVEWKDGHLTVEDLDHDSDPTWWKEHGARQWCDISELVNRGIPPRTERSAADAARDQTRRRAAGARRGDREGAEMTDDRPMAVKQPELTGAFNFGVDRMMNSVSLTFWFDEDADADTFFDWLASQSLDSGRIVLALDNARIKQKGPTDDR